MEIQTLGNLRLVGVEGLDQPQPLMLLAYLSLEGPKDRGHLADLFWPNAKTPLNNLSSALSRIRRADSDLVDAMPSVVAARCTSDARRLLEALDSGDIAAAADLYRGQFAPTAPLRNASMELEEWVLGTREYLATRVRDALLKQAMGRVASDPAGAARGAASAFHIGIDAVPDPGSLHPMFDILKAASHPLADKVAAEAREFGIVLGPEAPLPSHPTGGPVGRLPSSAPFVGRNNELARLATAAVPGQLVTLTGVGGIGKTRLARQFVSSAETSLRFPDRVYWANLTTVEDPGDVPAAIADIVGADLESGDTNQAIIEGIGPEPSLLVLDNFEQVDAAADIVEELMRALPDLSVVVTSRHRLRVPTETVIQLEGLGTDGSGPATPPDAIALFTERAMRSNRTFELSETTYSSVAAVCSIVGGLPLAIELVATWIRAIPLEDILAELRTNLALLESAEHDHTMDKVFARSWSLLSEQERQVLSDVSVFWGGFSRTAASAVTGASIATLASLVDKSMLQDSHDGRFWRHVLTYRYSLDKLAANPDHQSLIRRRHAEHMAAWLHDHPSGSEGSDSAGPSHGEIHDELDNLVEAWGFAISSRRWDILASLVPPFNAYLVNSGRSRLTQSLYSAAIDALDSTVDPDLTALLFSDLAWTKTMRGEIADAKRLIERGLEHASAGSNVRIQLLRNSGLVALNGGNVEQAMSFYTVAAGEVHDATAPRLAALLQDDLGEMYRYSEQYDKAEAAYRQSLEALSRMDDPALEALTYRGLGNLATDQGRYEEALERFQTGADIATTHGLVRVEAYFLAPVGTAQVAKGDMDKAEAAFTSGVALAEVSGEQWVLAENLLGLASVVGLTQGRIAATEHFVEGLRVAAAIGNWPLVLDGSLQAALLVAKESPDHPNIKNLIGLAAAHPASSPATRRRAQEWLATHAPASAGEASDIDPFSQRIDETIESVFALLRYG